MTFCQKPLLTLKQNVSLMGYKVIFLIGGSVTAGSVEAEFNCVDFCFPIVSKPEKKILTKKK